MVNIFLKNKKQNSLQFNRIEGLTRNLKKIKLFLKNIFFFLLFFINKILFRRNTIKFFN